MLFILFYFQTTCVRNSTLVFVQGIRFISHEIHSLFIQRSVSPEIMENSQFSVNLCILNFDN